MLKLERLTAQRLLQSAHVRHGFFTRQGGFSTGIYDSLNCGLGSKDDPENVRRNRARVSAAFGAKEIILAGVRQEHGSGVHVINDHEQAALRPMADGLVTSLPGIGLSILAADCAPVLFADPQARIIGAAHAGWKGALGGICEAVVEEMVKLGATPGAIETAIGPCISRDAYEVGADFERNFLERDSASGCFFTPSAKPDKRQFALGSYVSERISRAGLDPAENLNLCTYGDAQRFFSFRRATHLGEKDYGRAISVILLA